MANEEIVQRLEQFEANIERWKEKAAWLTLLAAKSRDEAASEADLANLEETASAIYADITAFRETVEEVAAMSPAAAAELSPVSDAIHLVLLEITELGIKLYSGHSGMPHGEQAPLDDSLVERADSVEKS